MKVFRLRLIDGEKLSCSTCDNMIEGSGNFAFLRRSEVTRSDIGFSHCKDCAIRDRWIKEV